MTTTFLTHRGWHIAAHGDTVRHWVIQTHEGWFSACGIEALWHLDSAVEPCTDCARTYNP